MPVLFYYRLTYAIIYMCACEVNHIMTDTVVKETVLLNDDLIKTFKVTLISTVTE